MLRQVMATLRKASALRRTLALGLLAAASAYVRAQRVVEGLALQYAVQPRPLAALLVAWLQARLLAPLHWLAQVRGTECVHARSCVGVWLWEWGGGGGGGGGGRAQHSGRPDALP